MKYFSVFVFIILGSACLFGQSGPDKIVAWVGKNPIYESEFLKRYELTPQFRRQQKGFEESLKLEFLYTLIAEKLWASEAVENHIDTAASFNTAYRAVEKMFVRDALYRKNILDPLKISDNEISEGLKLLKQKLKVNYLFSEDKKEIDNLYNLLLKGFPFDSLAVSSSSSAESREPSEITFGDMVKPVEEIVFNLRPGKFSKPINAPEGWYIFYVCSKANNILDDKTDPEEVVKNIIKKRKEKINYYNYLQKVLKGTKVDFSKEIFDKLAENVSSFIREKCVESSHQQQFRKLPFFFNRTDVIEFYGQMKNLDLKMPFISFEKNPVSLGKFLSELFFNGLTINSASAEEITIKLNTLVKSYIEKELLASEGYRLGLNLLPEVLGELKMWRDYYLQQSCVSEKLYDKNISDSALFDYYSHKFLRNDTSDVALISYVYNNDPEVMNAVIERLKKGEQIEELNKKYSMDYPQFKSGTWVPLFFLKNILDPKDGFHDNEIYGPLKADDGYLVFKLSDKKTINYGSESFNSLKDKLKNELLTRDKKLAAEKTALLASKYNVRINMAVLKEIKVTNINLVTVRKIGFGGSISGVPINQPNNDWIDYLQAGSLIQP